MCIGAGDGNRTRTTSLEGWGSTIELHPRPTSIAAVDTLARRMEVRFRLVDVFTERPFAGNQLCVVPDPPAELSSEQMQMLAAEIAFSETTFVTEAAADRYAMRIFTPAEELPFAGHPTLGTALALVSDGRVGSHPVQTTKAGDVPVEVDVDAGFAWMRQLAPRFLGE